MTDNCSLSLCENGFKYGEVWYSDTMGKKGHFEYLTGWQSECRNSKDDLQSDRMLPLMILTCIRPKLCRDRAIYKQNPEIQPPSLGSDLRWS